MAKKAKRPQPVADVSPGANPYENTKSTGRQLGNVLGCACLLMFILFDELWLGTLACAIAFGIIWGIQVFYDKVTKWNTSPYLYAMVLTLILAYLEYAYNIISNLLDL